MARAKGQVVISQPVTLQKMQTIARFAGLGFALEEVLYKFWVPGRRTLYTSSMDATRAIFIHIPKTAGMSVSMAIFGEIARGHIPAIRYEFADSQRFTSYLSFTVVRNPIERFGSAFRFLKSGGTGGRDALWAQKHLARYDDLDSFAKSLRRGYNRRLVLSQNHFVPQFRWVTDMAGRLLVTHIARYETLSEDIRMIQTRLGLPLRALPTLNRTPDTTARRMNHLSEDSRRLVEHIYQRDIRLFGYHSELDT